MLASVLGSETLATRKPMPASTLDGRTLKKGFDDDKLLEVLSTHNGIAYCAPESRSIGEIVRYLCLMHDCMTDEEMRGRIEFL
jgi:hypothetical protein